MPAAEIKETIPATPEAVFDLIHDYDRRLEWDTLLGEAYIEPGFEGAARGAVAVCRGKGLLGIITMRTEYVSFERGKVAAVKMLGRPPFFESFAASIRHRDLGAGRSEVIYKLNFRARPDIMRGLLHPPMLMLLRWETRKRLAALRRFFENGGTAN
jgi:hypothetical protein